MDRSPDTHVKRATLIALAGIMMWSVTIGLFRSVAEIFGAVRGAAMIFSVAAVFAHLVIGAPELKTLPRLYLWVGGGLFVLYEALLALSIGFATHRTQALELGMLNYLWPSLTILFAVILRQQRAHWLLMPAMVLCIVGIVFVMKGEGGWTVSLLLQHLRENPLGYGMALVAAVTWAVYSVFTRRFGNGLNGVPWFLTATAVVLWLAFVSQGSRPFVWHLPGLLQAAVMGMLMAMAYSCWNYSIQHGNLTVLATLSYFTPVTSVLIASVWLHVQPGLDFMLGAGLVTLGSVFSGCSIHLLKRPTTQTA